MVSLYFFLNCTNAIMRTAIKILLIAVVFTAAIISIRDYFTHQEKQELYTKSLMYEEELVALSKVLIEMQQLGEKYIILKSRNIDNQTRETILKEIEDFLKKSEGIGSKFSGVLNNYNSIVSAYNNLPQQFLWYKNSLPRALKAKAKEDYLQKN